MKQTKKQTKKQLICYLKSEQNDKENIKKKKERKKKKKKKKNQKNTLDHGGPDPKHQQSDAYLRAITAVSDLCDLVSDTVSDT